MRKIAVTGATSMIGLATIEEALNNGDFVYAIVRENSQNLYRLPKSANLKIIECDISKLKSLPSLINDRCDVFFHIGWGHTGAKRNENALFQVDNLYYILDAVSAAEMLSCKSFVGAGSQAEYGVLKEKVFTPSTPVNPTTPYGVCKYAASRLTIAECEKRKINCIWTRIFSVYGIYNKDTSLVMQCIDKMLKNEDVDLTKGEQNWDYLFSKDAGTAMYLAGIKGRHAETYCIGSGKTKTIREYTEIIAQNIHTKSKINFGAVPYKADTVMDLCADISSLQRDTGFVPKYSFDKGIEQTINWYKSLK